MTDTTPPSRVQEAVRAVAACGELLGNGYICIRPAGDHNHTTDLRAIVDEQANDEGLWFEAQTAPEAYLQAALRRLHAAVEEQQGISPEANSDNAAPEPLILTVDERSRDGAIQVSIGNASTGYRLAGPKYDGRGCQLLRKVLDDRDRAELRRWLA